MPLLDDPRPPMKWWEHLVFWPLLGLARIYIRLKGAGPSE